MEEDVKYGEVVKSQHRVAVKSVIHTLHFGNTVWFYKIKKKHNFTGVTAFTPTLLFW